MSHEFSRVNVKAHHILAVLHSVADFILRQALSIDWEMVYVGFKPVSSFPRTF
jgi:hypothetical protein